MYSIISLFFIQIINCKRRMDGPKNTYPSPQSFIQQTRALLRREQEEEMAAFQEMTSHKSAAEIEDDGAGLTNMVVTSSRDGFYGKLVISLTKSYYSEKNKVQLPENCKLSVGDDVGLFIGNRMIAQGVVYRRTAEKIKITINPDPEDEFNIPDEKLNIIMKWNEVTYRRYFSILDTLENPRLHFPLVDLFFKASATGYVPKKPEPYENKKMNAKQNEAIAHGLVQSCYLIHGPPGTGKTTTVCQLIVEAVARGQKVLACAPSNIAVDNLVEGVFERVNCVRVGNPARLISSIAERSLDYLISSKDGQWKNEEKKLNAALKKVRRADSRAEKKQLQGQIKVIRAQIQALQQQVIQEILTDADVICATNAGAGDRSFRKYLSTRMFDLVVIDQCGQGLEVSCWIPLIKGKRVVLAGDHKQLPPTVKFQANSLLSYTLFSRAMDQLTYIGSTMLEVQYRMNKIIMGWSNKQFYSNRLVAHSSVQDHTMQQIYEGVDEEEAVVLMIDTAGCQMGEDGGSMESKWNQGEADIVVSVYKRLLKYGVEPKNIAVLTPYSKQVALVKNLITQADVQLPEVSTVDGIQGREKQCIIISLVRSNPSKEIGFLKDWRRMNVAITRARRMLVLVGDSDCVSSDQHISSLLEWMSEHGSVQSAEEFRYDPNVRFGLGKTEQHKVMQGQAKNNEKEEKGKKKKREDKKKDNKPTAIEHRKQAPLAHTEEQSEQLKAQYLIKLVHFEKAEELHDLTAYERKIVHEVAEELGYGHVTSEDKKKITITPPVVEEPKQEIKQVKQSKKKKNKKTEQQQDKVQKAPQNMKELIGEQSSESDQEAQESKKEEAPKAELIQEAKIKKNKPKKEKKEKKADEEEDWEKLLDDFTSDMPKKDQCFKCQKKISSVTSTQCKYCGLYFCRHDLLAQEHGCQEAAREYARKGGNIDRFLQEGSRKIQQKLKQQEDKRRKKDKGDEKKKK